MKDSQNAMKDRDSCTLKAEEAVTSSSKRIMALEIDLKVKEGLLVAVQGKDQVIETLQQDLKKAQLDYSVLKESQE